jgi:hypothetical protein
VHMKRVRHRVNVETSAGLIQRYTGKGMVEARGLAQQVADGKPVTVYSDDVDAVFDLADQLTSFGVDAEADEGDY